MADNYIERQQELYEARKIAWSRSKRNVHKVLKEEQPHRKVFVLGGADGIGKVLVRAFCEAGHRVAFCDSDEKSGRMTAVQTGARFVLTDVCQPADLSGCVEQLLTEWGNPDVAVFSAEVTPVNVLESSVEDFDRWTAAFLRPLFGMLRALGMHRKASVCPPGRIILIHPAQTLFPAQTEVLARQLAEVSLTVNTLSVERGADGKPEQLEELVRTCLFLAENDFIKGKVL